MNYNIIKIIVSNFKLVDKKSEFSFKPNSLTILDGPNGYGKTTIFDSIEILINGKRNREEVLDTSSNTRNKPLTFANDPSKPVIIIGLFKGENDSFEIKRIFKRADKDGRSAKVKDASEIFIKVNDDFKPISEEDFHNKIGLTTNGNDFNILNYIQQEESTSFLKKKEDERIKELEHLFNPKLSTQTEHLY